MNVHFKCFNRIQRVIDDTKERICAKIEENDEKLKKVSPDEQIIPSHILVKPPKYMNLSDEKILEILSTEEIIKKNIENDANKQVFWGDLWRFNFNFIAYSPYELLYSDEEIENIKSLIDGSLRNELYINLFKLKFLDEYCDILNVYLRKRHDEFKRLGYPKREIVSIIQYLLYECDTACGRENKKKILRKMFKYLAKPYCKKFLADEKKFCHVVKQKLIELRNDPKIHNFREAGVWWRNIFGTRMPVEDLINEKVECSICCENTLIKDLYKNTCDCKYTYCKSCYDKLPEVYNESHFLIKRCPTCRIAL